MFFVPPDTQIEHLSQLQAIFRVDPDTVCNTHELLECSCDASGTRPVSTQTSSVAGSDSDGDEIQDGFVVASSINPARPSKNEKEVRIS